jgi:hypothetical protein
MVCPWIVRHDAARCSREHGKISGYITMLASKDPASETKRHYTIPTSRSNGRVLYCVPGSHLMEGKAQAGFMRHQVPLSKAWLDLLYYRADRDRL